EEEFNPFSTGHSATADDSSGRRLQSPIPQSTAVLADPEDGTSTPSDAFKVANEALPENFKGTKAHVDMVMRQFQRSNPKVTTATCLFSEDKKNLIGLQMPQQVIQDLTPLSAIKSLQILDVSGRPGSPNKLKLDA